jgi:alpha-aminoadipate carrier protein LysW
MASPKKSQKPKVKCPQCGAEVDIDPKTEEGEIIECPECGCELEIVKKGTKFDVECVEDSMKENDDLGEGEEAEDLE